MAKTASEIARQIEGTVSGDGSAVINGVCGIEEAGPGDLTFLSNPRYAPYLARTKASAVIAGKDVTAPAGITLINVDNPSLGFTRAMEFLFPQQESHPRGMSDKAVVSRSARLGKGVAVGACAVIEDEVTVGDNTVIYPGCFLGRGSSVGSNTVIHANVSVREQCSIGSNCIIHSGTVVGSDGFGFVTINGKHRKIPQVGIVVVEDDVEIGANVTIDRARFDKTLIGQGTKIDNLVQIAHNVVIGKNCLIVALTGIAGSSKIGDNCILAGQCALVGHITLGNNCLVLARSGVTKSWPDNSILWGSPAKLVEEAKRINACVQSLPKLNETVSALKKRLAELDRS